MDSTTHKHRCMNLHMGAFVYDTVRIVRRRTSWVLLFKSAMRDDLGIDLHNDGILLLLNLSFTKSCV